MNVLLAALAGLAAGGAHVLAGPDHLAAIAPLAVSSGVGSWRIGLRWGLGHALGALALGVLLLLLRGLAPLELPSADRERLVGAALIGIGAWTLRRAARSRPDPHAHRPGGLRHVHHHAALGIGLLHGAAGHSHLFGLLPALALPTALASATYLATFAAGTVLGMIGFAALGGLAGARLAAAGGRAHALLLGSLGALAGGVGIWWLVR